MNAISLAMALYRKNNPASRALNPAKIIRNGSVKRVYECCFCRSTHSVCRKWREPKHLREWQKEHEACADRYLQRFAEAGGDLRVRLGIDVDASQLMPDWRPTFSIPEDRYAA